MNDKKPSEWTFSDYISEVEVQTGAVIEITDEYPEEYDSLRDAVHSAIDGARAVTMPGYALVAVLHSDTDPDYPDYASPWVEYVDRSELTWANAVCAMAYICVFDDVYKMAKQCPKCGGIGERGDDGKWVECKDCDGSGERDIEALLTPA